MLISNQIDGYLISDKKCNFAVEFQDQFKYVSYSFKFRKLDNIQRALLKICSM